MPKPFSPVAENASIFVVSKLAAVPVLPDKDGSPSLKALVEGFLRARDGKLPGRCEPPHRLDRPVSGLVLFAKTDKALASLSQAFAEGLARKRYLALAESAPPAEEGELRHAIGWDARGRKARIRPAGAEGAGFKPCALKYRLLGKTDRYFLIEVEPLTGRSHQIRAQLAAAGCVVRGDLKYGARRSNPSGMISLHSWKLELPGGLAGCGDDLSFAAPLPLPANYPDCAEGWEADAAWEAAAGILRG